MCETEESAARDQPEIEQERLKKGLEFYFIDACGDEAKRWRAELCSTDNILLQIAVKDSMRMFKRYNLAAGLDLLASVDCHLRSGIFSFVSIVWLLRRFEYSARAYAEYLVDDLESAKVSLAKSSLEVSKIVGRHEFLIPLAVHCTDFFIQRARIARRERRWAQVREYLDILEGIFADSHPYCVLDSGRRIMLSDIREFLASLPLNDEQRARTRLFLGEDSPIRDRMEEIEELIFSFPDMVIPYP